MNNPEGNHEGFEQSLLIDDEGELPIAAKQKVVDDNEPPYSPRNEVNFSFYKDRPCSFAPDIDRDLDYNSGGNSPWWGGSA